MLFKDRFCHSLIGQFVENRNKNIESRKKKMRLLIILSFFPFALWSANPTDLILNARVATTLSGVSIFPDSTFEKQSTSSFKVGELLEVLRETVSEYEDASQNQKFKWYKVRSLKGKEGWVYGDGIAVMIPKNQIDPKLKTIHRQKYHFNNGFEKSIAWIGGIEGRDNFHEKDFLNPPYKEYYIIITNERGNCVFVNHSSENARGKMNPRHILFHDTTGDEIPELLLQTSSFSSDDGFENRIFEIYSFQAGGFNRIFEERMSLPHKNNNPSPAIFKFVEVDEQIIRIAYVDYLACNNYMQSHDYGKYLKQKEYCVEYVTYTYSWNERTRQYRMMYKESRTAPVLGARRDMLVIKEEPSVIGKPITTIGRSDRMELIKQHDRSVLENGVKKSVPYFYVKLKDGRSGFVEAEHVGFIDIEHTPVLNSYYQSQETAIEKWKTEYFFLTISGDNRSSFTEIKP